MRAHVDESHRPGLYVLAAALVDERTLPFARDALDGLRVGRTPRLHWRNERHARRLVIASTVTGLGITGLAAVRRGSGNQETARARCLTALLRALPADVSLLVVESRAEADRRDARTLRLAHDAGIGPRGLRYRFARADAEPALWAADTIAGAVHAHAAGGTSDYFDLLQVSVVEV